MRGTVISGTHNQFSVECDDKVVRLCAIKGKRLDGTEELHNVLAPGDVVEIDIMPNYSTDCKRGMERGVCGMITAAVERRNGFYRWNSKSGKKQLLAANVDIVLLVTSAEHPPFRPRFIDRALVQCDAAGLLPWIVCNKCDLTADAQFAKRVAIWASLGITVLRLSAVTGEGVKELHTRLIRYNLRHAATVAVLVGQSGVGKSSLVNALIGNGGDAHLSRREGALCTKYDRGAHTTAVGTLIRLPYSDGRKCIGLVDTPGVRRFELHDIAAEDLALHFAEMSPYVGKCRYGMSCTHESEDGCAIRAAVERGEISAERYDSFRRIKIDIQAVRQDEGG